MKRAEANKEVEAAIEKGDQENINKFSRRTVKVTKEVYLFIYISIIKIAKNCWS